MSIVERLMERFLADPEGREDIRRISELKRNFGESIEVLLNGQGGISFNTEVDWPSPSEWTYSKDFPSIVTVHASKHRRLRSQYSFSIARVSPQSTPLLAFKLRGDTFTVLKENRPVTIMKSCFPVDELEVEIYSLENALKVVQLVTEARQTSS